MEHISFHRIVGAYGCAENAADGWRIKVITQGPYRWERIKSELDGKWYATLVGKPNRWNDRLVTAMREDLAQFPYAIRTGNALLIEKSFDLYASLLELVDHAMRSRLWPHEALTRARSLLDEIRTVEKAEDGCLSPGRRKR